MKKFEFKKITLRDRIKAVPAILLEEVEFAENPYFFPTKNEMEEEKQRIDTKINNVNKLNLDTCSEEDIAKATDTIAAIGYVRMWCYFCGIAVEEGIAHTRCSSPHRPTIICYDCIEKLNALRK